MVNIIIPQKVEWNGKQVQKCEQVFRYQLSSLVFISFYADFKEMKEKFLVIERRTIIGAKTYLRVQIVRNNRNLAKN